MYYGLQLAIAVRWLYAAARRMLGRAKLSRFLE